MSFSVRDRVALLCGRCSLASTVLHLRLMWGEHTLARAGFGTPENTTHKKNRYFYKLFSFVSTMTRLFRLNFLFGTLKPDFKVHYLGPSPHDGDVPLLFVQCA